MMKKVLAAAVALSLTGASLALAQQGPDRGAARWRPSTEDVAALTDARIAALKTGLKLTPDQEKNWPAVETAIRDMSKERADRMKARMERMASMREQRRGGDAKPTPDFVTRLRARADAMTARAASLKKFADATDPLYKTLDEGQKHRFAMLIRAGQRGPHERGHGHWHRRG